MAITKIQSESLNLSDNYDFTGTVTGAGESNAPYFFAGKSGDQQISNNTVTKIQMNNEILDSASAYDPSSNYRFTPQTAGKYFVSVNFSMYATLQFGTTDLENIQCFIYKNGSNMSNTRGAIGYSGNPGQFGNVSTSAIVTMNGSSDYLEVFGYGRTVSGNNTGVESGNSNFYAFLISTT
jgi:hypothetical protein